MKNKSALLIVSALFVCSLAFSWDGTGNRIISGRKTVATAGTSEQVLSTSLPCHYIEVTAETDNTGVIVYGDSAVVAALATREGTPLSAGDRAVIPINDVNKVYIDSTVNGDGVTYNVII